MLTFEFTGVEGLMTESEVLTGGMVGKTVRILFDDSWASLTKTVVFRAGETCRIAEGGTSPVIIPADVLARPWRKLYVGVYGTDESGTVVIPTIMAEGPMIRYGADPTEDSTAEDLPVWRKLQDQIGDLELLETDARDSLVSAINEIHSQLETGTDGGTGLSETAAALLIEILRHAVYATDQTAVIDALEKELLPGAGGEGEDPDIPSGPEVPEVTMTHITAVYSGGDVAVGTTLSDLTGITVTAHYSDGTAETVSGYTLSGQILEGQNTVTVSYGDMTATFTVTGIAETEPEVTMTGISAAYSGGDVAVGTALADLTGITVTAHYSDGTAAAVSGYTLSGQILEGQNTVTVTYSGMTATFTVTGIAETEPGVTMTGISATYSGGDVAVGTALADLTGITVTAHYSDGVNMMVEDFELSGQIAEGENIITVTYEGKTATFTVTGIAQSGGSNVLAFWDFTSGSLVDSVNSIAATTSTDITLDALGAHTTSNASYIQVPLSNPAGSSLGSNILEVKFGNISITDTGSAQRLMMIGKVTGLQPFSVGMFWSTKDCWTNATATITEFNELNMWSGKILTLKEETGNNYSIHCDGTKIVTCGGGFPAGYFSIGSSGSSLAGVTVESIKIYSGS